MHRAQLGHDLMAMGGLVLMIALIFRRVVAGRVLAGGDLQTYFYPYWVAMARVVKGGESLLWNPALFAGAPLLANSQVGALYPLNWVLWLIAQPSLAGIARVLHWSVIGHLWLGALSVYMLSRRLGYGRWGAMLAGLIYAGSGFLGTHSEHLNQLQALAWLPLLLLPPVNWRGDHGLGFLELPRPLSIVAFAMILLAGHTQMAFIALVALAGWRLVGVGLIFSSGRRERYRISAQTWHNLGRLARRWFALLLPFGLAFLVAAAQLVPTIELAALSGRGVGLDWREAVSFSVALWEAHRALLPPYLAAPLYPEGVAYLGIMGLLLAIAGAWVAYRRRNAVGWGAVALVALGIFLALGGYNPLYLLLVRAGVPGLAHFRAPARFLALYGLGGALLAGLGAQGVTRWVGRRQGIGRLVPRFAPAGLVVVLGAELLLSAEALPHADATASRAYTDLRPATAHLVAASQAAEQGGQPTARFLSISQMLFEVGDKAEIEAVYGDALSPDAMLAYLVAAKQRDILAPNLSLAFGVSAVDGYDGGLLPLRHYIAFSELLLPGGTLDGRLRENLREIPDQRWLDLLGVRHLLTDKTGDVWRDGILYDRQFQPTLAPGEALRVGWLPDDFLADGLALLAEGTGGEVTLDLNDGRVIQRSFESSAEGDGPQWVRWDEPALVTALEVRASSEGLQLFGASLWDGRVEAFYPLVLSESFRLGHSGDVKIYEDLTPPARAFLVHGCQVTTSDSEALRLMRDPVFDPFTTVVLMEDRGVDAERCYDLDGAATLGEERVSVRYEGGRVVVDVVAADPGYLVLTDAWYPGWRAKVSDASAAAERIRTTAEGTGSGPTSPLRADLLFRALPIDPGAWKVVFEYEPRALYAGLGLSVLGIFGLLVYAFYTNPRT
ncbi:MAG: hypothetical protein ACP5HS_00580 [Anaerolineae bacterium]